MQDFSFTKILRYFSYVVILMLGFLGSSASKESIAVQETVVWILGWEVPLEKGMATHSSIPAGESPKQRSLVDCIMGCKESNATEWLSPVQHNVSALMVINSCCSIRIHISPHSYQYRVWTHFFFFLRFFNFLLFLFLAV